MLQCFRPIMNIQDILDDNNDIIIMQKWIIIIMDRCMYIKMFLDNQNIYNITNNKLFPTKQYYI